MANGKQASSMPSEDQSLLKHIVKKRTEHHDQVLKIETNIDNQTPEQLGYVMDLLLEHGALDVFTPIHMKTEVPFY